MHYHKVKEILGSVEEVEKLANQYKRLAEINNLIQIDNHVQIRQRTLCEYIPEKKGYFTVWDIYISEDLRQNIGNF